LRAEIALPPDQVLVLTLATVPIHSINTTEKLIIAVLWFQIVNYQFEVAGLGSDNVLREFQIAIIRFKIAIIQLKKMILQLDIHVTRLHHEKLKPDGVKLKLYDENFEL
jgi:hypothetical protein